MRARPAPASSSSSVASAAFTTFTFVRCSSGSGAIFPSSPCAPHKAACSARSSRGGKAEATQPPARALGESDERARASGPANCCWML